MLLRWLDLLLKLRLNALLTRILGIVMQVLYSISVKFMRISGTAVTGTSFVDVARWSGGWIGGGGGGVIIKRIEGKIRVKIKT